MTDVLVVGGGLGGSLAALSAIREEPSASVRLLAPRPDRFGHETGLIDLLGYPPDDDQPLARPLYELRGLPDDHPYSRVGLGTVQDGFALFDDEFGTEGGYHRGRLSAGDWSQGVGSVLDTAESESRRSSGVTYSGKTGQNALVGTCTGNVKPTSRYPASVAAGLVSDERPMHVVGFEQETHLDAALFADRLDDRVNYEVDSTTVEFPMDVPEYPPAVALARALDENEQTADGKRLRGKLAATVRPHLDVEPRVGFPAVLGLEASEQVRGTLEDLLQADVFEIPIGPPSVPGLRLRELLYERLDAAGVTVQQGATVTGFESENGEIQKVTVGEESPETVDATEYILATGGLETGGIEATRTAVRESVFDCYIAHSDDRSEWHTEEFLGDHPFARFGLDVTDDLQPCGPNGDSEYGNLRAVGTLLGGYDFTREHSRGGVAVATGYEAGRLAVEDVS